MPNIITVPQLAWHGAKELMLPLPDGWQAETCNMSGYDRPKLGPDAIKDSIGSPLGMAPLREYARGKREAVIIFDDMARVTRVAGLVPAVLDELAAAGIGDSHIRFVAACGCHAAMNRADFAKKLGDDVMARFPVYNHSPFDNCVHAGTTTRGTEVCINAEVMKCDLKIGIGSVVPHIMAGFGGGNKLVLPGVASFESVLALHSSRPGEDASGSTVTGMGATGNNPRRRDIDEAADIVGLDMKIDAIVNLWGETTAVFAGAPAPAYAAALEAARAHYLTPKAKECDVVIANTFAKANEAVSGVLVAYPSVKRGGDVVLIANAPEGQITHYLMGPFGNEISGQLGLKMKVPEHVNRLIVFSEYPELSSRNYLEDSDKVLLVSDWNEVLKLLREKHGPGARVAVYPNADIQYCGE